MAWANNSYPADDCSASVPDLPLDVLRLVLPLVTPAAQHVPQTVCKEWAQVLSDPATMAEWILHMAIEAGATQGGPYGSSALASGQPAWGAAASQMPAMQPPAAGDPRSPAAAQGEQEAGRALAVAAAVAAGAQVHQQAGGPPPSGSSSHASMPACGHAMRDALRKAAGCPCGPKASNAMVRHLLAVRGGLSQLGFASSTAVQHVVEPALMAAAERAYCDTAISLLVALSEVMPQGWDPANGTCRTGSGSSSSNSSSCDSSNCNNHMRVSTSRHRDASTDGSSTTTTMTTQPGRVPPRASSTPPTSAGDTAARGGGCKPGPLRDPLPVHARFMLFAHALTKAAASGCAPLVSALWKWESAHLAHAAATSHDDASQGSGVMGVIAAGAAAGGAIGAGGADAAAVDQALLVWEEAHGSAALMAAAAAAAAGGGAHLHAGALHGGMGIMVAGRQSRPRPTTVLEYAVSEPSAHSCLARALQAAAAAGHEKCVRLLLKKGMHITGDEILAAAEGGHTGVLRLMAGWKQPAPARFRRYGADPVCGSYGRKERLHPALRKAVQRGHLPAIQAILSVAGARLCELVDEDMLQAAVGLARMDVVAALLPPASPTHIPPLLTAAVKSGNPGIAQALLHKLSLAGLSSRVDFTAVLDAAGAMGPEMARVVLPHAATDAGAVTIAIRRGDVGRVRDLMEHGALASHEESADVGRHLMVAATSWCMSDDTCASLVSYLVSQGCYHTQAAAAALLHATQQPGRAATCRALVAAGANPACLSQVVQDVVSRGCGGLHVAQNLLASSVLTDGDARAVRAFVASVAGGSTCKLTMEVPAVTCL